MQKGLSKHKQEAAHEDIIFHCLRDDALIAHLKKDQDNYICHLEYSQNNTIRYLNISQMTKSKNKKQFTPIMF